MGKSNKPASGRQRIWVKVIRKDSPFSGMVFPVLADGYDPEYLQHLTTVRSGKARVRMPTSWLQVSAPPAPKARAR